MTTEMDRLSIEKVLRNLSKEISKISKRSEKGLALAALHVKGKAQEYTPIDEGNLRSSAYVISSAGMEDKGQSFSSKKGADIERLKIDHEQIMQENKTLIRGLMAVIGYTAFYAAYVHEIDNAYKADGVSWKFLAKALNEERLNILKIIADEARIR